MEMPRGKELGAMGAKSTKGNPRRGDAYSPRHMFDLYADVRASVALPPGAKLAWQSLGEKIYPNQKYVEYSYDKIARDIGLKRDQAKRYIKVLRMAGMLRMKTRFKERHQAANRFEFLWVPPKDIRTGTMGLTGRRQGGRRERKPDSDAAPLSGAN